MKFDYEKDLEFLLERLLKQYEDYRTRLIDPWISIKDKTILEIGYGSKEIHNGFNLNIYLRAGAAACFGIDSAASENSAEQYKFRDFISKKGFLGDSNKPVLLHMNSQNMWFKDNMFDCIYSNATLEHIQNPAQAFLEMYRVLKPGGIAVHCWNPYTSLTMGGHDIGIPFYYPWAHLRLDRLSHIEILEKIFADPAMRTQISVIEHTLSEELFSSIKDLYLYYDHHTRVLLNKVRTRDMINFAKEAGFELLDQYFQEYNGIDYRKFLTADISKELTQYTEEELGCANHILILRK